LPEPATSTTFGKISGVAGWRDETLTKGSGESVFDESYTDSSMPDFSTFLAVAIKKDAPIWDI
jgi:hypothetical protein